MDISAWVLPLLLSAVGLWGIGRRADVYAALVRGAEEGLRVLPRIFASLVVLLPAIAMFRASGALEWLADAAGPLCGFLGIPAEVLPLMLVRPVSGGGALAVAGELIRAHGPDSLIGRTAAVMLGSTETTFYTIAVYFGAAGIQRSRHAVPAALVADLTGFLAAAWTVRLFFG